VEASRREQGFTLLEILIVVALIATFASIVGARIGGGIGIAISGEGRVVVAELRHAGQRALATGRTQRWVVDLDAQAFRLEERIEVEQIAADWEQALQELLQTPTSKYSFVPVQNRYGNWRWLDEEAVRFDGVQTRNGFFDQGAISIGFGADGGANMAVIYLSDEHQNRLGIHVGGFTGSVRVLDEDALDDEQLFDVPPELPDLLDAANQEEPDEDEDLLEGEDNALD
jgi:prepilin-type N-terminal cleavage/methylation domain-containing protein